jgi:hypothetical protein
MAAGCECIDQDMLIDAAIRLNTIPTRGKKHPYKDFLK